MSMIKLFKLGQEYMQTCPKDKRLTMTFPEIKIIYLTQAAIKFMPPVVVLVFVWQYYMHAGLILSSITALFALSLPFQGVFWLGHRARTVLPLALVEWYNQLTQKLIAKQILPKPNAEHEIVTRPLPNFMDLMKLLNLAKKHLGDYFDLDDPQDSESIQ